MLAIADSIADETIWFYYVENKLDLQEVAHFIKRNQWLAIDTESTGLNCYLPDWRLRLVQIGNAVDCYVIPARYRRFIATVMASDVHWIAHNGPHDIRSIDTHLRYETGVSCEETFIPSHHRDSRNRQEGGVGHGLKELAIALVDREAGKWEKALKEEFKRIEIPMEGMVYKSGPKKGQQRYRKAKLSEGWGLIDPANPTYIAYAAADPILTFRVWQRLQSTVRNNLELYRRDKRIQAKADLLQRRGIRLDHRYATRLSAAYESRAKRYSAVALSYGCANIYSGPQLAATLGALGVRLTERTDKGALKTDDAVLRKVLTTAEGDVKDFIRAVLLAKQMLKRRTAYTEQMLHECDAAGRVHPSINTLGARTTRMSVSHPALQQLPTKDRDDE